MRILRRTMTVAILVATLALATVGAAFATEADESVVLDLDTLKARVIERIDARIEAMESRLDQLAGREGPMAEQVRALLTEGIALAGQLRSDVQAAEDAAEIHGLIREARGEFFAHARVHVGYAHVQNDLAKFTHRVELLEQAITRAASAGLDTTEAVAEASAARGDLTAAAATLAAVNPSATGAPVLEQIRAAHQDAHSAQFHIRVGFRSLAEQVL